MSKKENKFRSAYGEKLKVVLTTGEGLTEQCHKDECDINKIIAKYDRTGVLNHVNEFEAQYGDLTGIDYQTMLNTVSEANSMFEGLPSQIRNKFENDPSKFLSFVDDENNYDAMVEMGIAKAKPVPVDSGVVDAVGEAGNATESATNTAVEAEKNIAS